MNYFINALNKAPKYYFITDKYYKTAQAEFSGYRIF